jgi:hypothetical protein
MLTQSLKTGLNLVYDSKLNIREIKSEVNSMPRKLRLTSLSFKGRPRLQKVDEHLVSAQVGYRTTTQLLSFLEVYHMCSRFPWRASAMSPEGKARSFLPVQRSESNSKRSQHLLSNVAFIAGSHRIHMSSNVPTR